MPATGTMRWRLDMGAEADAGDPQWRPRSGEYVPHAAPDEHLAIHDEGTVTQHGVHNHVRAQVWTRPADGAKLTQLTPLIRLVHIR